MVRQVFSCRTYAKRGHHVVEVTGDVTFETIESLRQEFANLRMQAPNLVVLDLMGVTMLSSVGLGELSRLIKWGLENNCSLKVVCETGHVLEVLEIAGITDMIALFPNLDMALNG
jgi:anti-anti-sigma factor